MGRKIMLPKENGRQWKLRENGKKSLKKMGRKEWSCRKKMGREKEVFERKSLSEKKVVEKMGTKKWQRENGKKKGNCRN